MIDVFIFLLLVYPDISLYIFCNSLLSTDKKYCLHRWQEFQQRTSNFITVTPIYGHGINYSLFPNNNAKDNSCEWNSKLYLASPQNLTKSRQSFLKMESIWDHRCVSEKTSTVRVADTVMTNFEFGLQYIPRIMHRVAVMLCFVLVRHLPIYPDLHNHFVCPWCNREEYEYGLLHHHMMQSWNVHKNKAQQNRMHISWNIII